MDAFVVKIIDDLENCSWTLNAAKRGLDKPEHSFITVSWCSECIASQEIGRGGFGDWSETRPGSERIENIAALNELYVLRAIAFVRATENKFAKSNQTPKETRNGIY